MWARLVTVGLGIWLMAAPALLGYGSPAATVDRIVGPVAMTVAIVAMSEATRPIRWVNLAFGAWLVIAPWLFGYGTAASFDSVVVGVALGALSLVKGPVRERFGGGWSSLCKRVDLH